MKSINVLSVSLWDGGERHNFAFYIEEGAATIEQIKKAHPHCDVQPTTLLIFGSLTEVEQNSIKNLRRQAWTKLTPAERKALKLPVREEDL